MSRSALDRLLRREGVSRLNDLTSFISRYTIIQALTVRRPREPREPLE